MRIVNSSGKPYPIPQTLDPAIRAITEKPLNSYQDIIDVSEDLINKITNEVLVSQNLDSYINIFDAIDKQYEEFCAKIVEKGTLDNLDQLIKLLRVDLTLYEELEYNEYTKFDIFFDVVALTFDFPVQDLILNFFMKSTSYSERINDTNAQIIYQPVRESIAFLNEIDLNEIGQESFWKTKLSVLKEKIFEELRFQIENAGIEPFIKDEKDLDDEKTLVEIKRFFKNQKAKITEKKRIELSSHLTLMKKIEGFLKGDKILLYDYLLSLSDYSMNMTFENFDFSNLELKKYWKKEELFLSVYKEYENENLSKIFLTHMEELIRKNHNSEENPDEKNALKVLFAQDEQGEIYINRLLKKIFEDHNYQSRCLGKHDFETFIDRISIFSQNYHNTDRPMAENFKVFHEMLIGFILKNYSNEEITKKFTNNNNCWIRFFNESVLAYGESFQKIDGLKYFKHIDSFYDKILNGQTDNLIFFCLNISQLSLDQLNLIDFDPKREILEFLKSRKYVEKLQSELEDPKNLKIFKQYPYLLISIISLNLKLCSISNSMTKEIALSIRRGIEILLEFDLTLKYFSEIISFDLCKNYIVAHIDVTEFTIKLSDYYIRNYARSSTYDVLDSQGTHPDQNGHLKKLFEYANLKCESSLKLLDKYLDDILQSECPEKLINETVIPEFPSNIIASFLILNSLLDYTLTPDQIKTVEEHTGNLMAHPCLAILPRSLYESKICDNCHRKLARKQHFNTMMKIVHDKLNSISLTSNENIRNIKITPADVSESSDEDKKSYYYLRNASHKLTKLDLEFTWLCQYLSIQPNAGRYDDVEPNGPFYHLKEIYPILFKFFIEVFVNWISGLDTKEEKFLDKLKEISDFCSNQISAMKNYFQRLIDIHELTEKEGDLFNIFNEEIIEFTTSLIKKSGIENIEITCEIAMSPIIKKSENRIRNFKDSTGFPINQDYLQILSSIIPKFYDKCTYDIHEGHSNYYSSKIISILGIFKQYAKLDNQNLKYILAYLVNVQNFSWHNFLDLIPIPESEINRWIRLTLSNKISKGSKKKSSSLFERVEYADDYEPSSEDEDAEEATETEQPQQEEPVKEEISNAEAAIGTEKTEEVKTEEVNNEEATNWERNTEEVNTKELSNEEVNNKGATNWERNTEEVNSEEINNEEVNAEGADAEEVNNEEVDTKEVKTEEIKTEEIKTEPNSDYKILLEFIEKFDWSISYYLESITCEQENLFTSKYPKIIQDSNIKLINVAYSILNSLDVKIIPSIEDFLKEKSLLPSEINKIPELSSQKSIIDILIAYNYYLKNAEPINSDPEFMSLISKEINELGFFAMLTLYQNAKIDSTNKTQITIWGYALDNLVRFYKMRYSQEKETTHLTTILGFLVEYVKHDDQDHWSSNPYKLIMEYVNSFASENAEFRKIGLDFINKICIEEGHDIAFLWGYHSIFNILNLEHSIPADIHFEYIVKSEFNPTNVIVEDFTNYLYLLDGFSETEIREILNQILIFSDKVFVRDSHKIKVRDINLDILSAVRATLSVNAKSFIKDTIEKIVQHSIKPRKEGDKLGNRICSNLIVSFETILETYPYMIPYVIFHPIDKKIFESVEISKTPYTSLWSDKLKSDQITFLDVLIYLLIPLSQIEKTDFIEFFVKTCKVKVKYDGERPEFLRDVIADKIIAIVLRFLAQEDPKFLLTPQSRQFWNQILSLAGNINEITLKRNSKSLISQIFKKFLTTQTAKKFAEIMETEALETITSFLQGKIKEDIFVSVIENWNKVEKETCSHFITIEKSTSVYEELLNQTEPKIELAESSPIKNIFDFKDVSATDQSRFWGFARSSKDSNDTSSKKKNKKVPNRGNWNEEPGYSDDEEDGRGHWSAGGRPEKKKKNSKNISETFISNISQNLIQYPQAKSENVSLIEEIFKKIEESNTAASEIKTEEGERENKAENVGSIEEKQIGEKHEEVIEDEIKGKIEENTEVVEKAESIVNEKIDPIEELIKEILNEEFNIEKEKPSENETLPTENKSEEVNENTEEITKEKESKDKDEEVDEDVDVDDKPKSNHKYKYFIDHPIKSKKDFQLTVNNYRLNLKPFIEAVCVSKFSSKITEKSLSRDLFESLCSHKSKFEKNSILLGLGKIVSFQLDESLKSQSEKADEEYQDIIENWEEYEKAFGIIKVEEFDIKKESSSEKRPRRYGRRRRNNEDNTEEMELYNGRSAKVIEGMHIDREDHVFFNKEEIQPQTTSWVRTTFSDPSKEKQKEEDDEVDKKLIAELKEDYIYSDDEIAKILQFFMNQAANSIQINDLLFHPVNMIKFLDFVFFLGHNQNYLEEDTLGPFKSMKNEMLCQNSNFWIKITNFIETQWILLDKLKPCHLSLENSEKMKEFKAKVNYENTISGYNSLIDAFISLAIGTEKTPPIVTISKVFDLLDSIIRRKKRHSDIKNEIFFSPEMVFKMYNLLIKSKTPEADLSKFLNLLDSLFESNPSIFASNYEFISSVLFPRMSSISKLASSSIKLLRDSLSQQKPIKITEALENFDKNELKFTDTILSFIIKGYAEILIEPKSISSLHKPRRGQKKADISQEMFNKTSETLLKHHEELHSQEVKTYVLEIYELLELIARAKLHESDDSKLSILIDLCMLNASLIYIQEKLKTEMEASNLPMPVLKTLASGEFDEDLVIPNLNKTFSAIKSEKDVDLPTVFINFAAKYKTLISEEFIDYDEDSGNRRRRENKTKNQKEYIVLVERFPWLFTTQAKREILLSNLKHLVNQDENSISIKVDRKFMVYSFAKEISNLERIELMQGLEVEFEGEDGIDQGGLRSELFSKTCQEIFSPLTGLFKDTPNGTNLEINLLSTLVPNHLKLFEFAGIILAKAILEKVAVGVNLNRSLLKKMLGLPVVISDLDDIDAELSKHMQWVLENNVDGISTYFIYHQVNSFGEDSYIELCENGGNIEVTNTNKADFVKKLCDYRMHKIFEPQLNAFVDGFRAVLPPEMTTFLRSSDLDLLIAGNQTIDLADLKSHFKFEGNAKGSIQAAWLFEILDEYSQEQLHSFFQFLTGRASMSKVPVGGFKTKSLSMEFGNHSEESLPVAHTCYWQLEVPKYSSKEKFAQKMLYAFYEAAEGFDIR